MRVPALLTAGSLSLSACAPRDTGSSGGAAAATPPVVTITAKDMAFTAPDTIVGGMTTLRMVNEGPNLHHVQLVRLDSGKTLADLQAAMKNPGPPPAWAVLVPGPNAADPGMESNETIDLAPGNYALLCFVDIPEHVPHFAKGMVKALTVTAPSGASAAAPAADVTMTLSDFSFALSKPLVAGKQVVEVTVAGSQPHEVEILRFEPGKTMDDLGKWMQKMQGPPPARAIGGVSGAAPGSKAYFSVDLVPGDYALVCFVLDPKDGKPHLEKGMVQVLKIS